VSDASLHAAIEALALENARLRAELAAYRALEQCGPERVYAALTGVAPDRDNLVERVLAEAYYRDLGGDDE
jgi:hypothetical protein